MRGERPENLDAERRSLAGDQHGVSAVEYAILVALIVMASMGVIQMIGANFEVLYTIIANALPAGLG